MTNTNPNTNPKPKKAASKKGTKAKTTGQSKVPQRTSSRIAAAAANRPPKNTAASPDDAAVVPLKHRNNPREMVFNPSNLPPLPIGLPTEVLATAPVKPMASKPKAKKNKPKKDYHKCTPQDLVLLQEAAEKIGVGKTKALLTSIKDGNCLNSHVYTNAILEPFFKKAVPKGKKLSFGTGDDSGGHHRLLVCSLGCGKCFNSPFLPWFPWQYAPIALNYDWTKALCHLHLNHQVTTENLMFCRGMMKAHERKYAVKIKDSHGKEQEFGKYIASALDNFKAMLHTHYATYHANQKEKWPLMALKAKERKALKESAGYGGTLCYATLLICKPENQLKNLDPDYKDDESRVSSYEPLPTVPHKV